MKLIKLYLLSFFFVATTSALAATSIKHVKVEDPRNQLILNILKLSLDKSSFANDYEFVAVDEALTEVRAMEYIKREDLTVTWMGTQVTYEEEMRPIRVPILKGMLGHRIFIIRQGDQGRFDRINSLDDLKRVQLGQGRFWGDTQILREAGMNIVDPVKYESLFHMLEGGRFDFFPRAIHEPWNEVTRWDNLNLTVERNILLIYPFALYFFVSNENVELAKAIESGFRQAITDGSYDQLFYADPTILDTLQKSNLKNRKVFRLDNPFMHPDTPVNEKELWLDLSIL